MSFLQDKRFQHLNFSKSVVSFKVYIMFFRLIPSKIYLKGILPNPLRASLINFKSLNHILPFELWISSKVKLLTWQRCMKDWQKYFSDSLQQWRTQWIKWQGRYLTIIGYQELQTFIIWHDEAIKSLLSFPILNLCEKKFPF